MIKYFFSISLLFLALFFVGGCDNNIDVNSPENTELFQIDLQTGFSNSEVTVSIDNSVVFNDTITSSYIIVRASSFQVEIKRGVHSIRIMINDSITLDTTFLIADTLYAAINFDPRTSKIMFGVQDYPFGYR